MGDLYQDSVRIDCPACGEFCQPMNLGQAWAMAKAHNEEYELW